MAKVLVVDDNDDACHMMARLVQRCGHESVCATSGEQALEYLRAHVVGLVILDNMMPGINGLEVLRQLRLDPTTAGTPVVMWSAVADQQFIAHARSKGANDYWVKAGFNYAELPRMLGKVLSGGC